MKSIIILENIRSAYNVGNVIRTADALWWDVAFAGYTPNPETQPKVKKTSLGAEESVGCRIFADSSEAILALRNEGFHIIAAEITENAVSLHEFSHYHDKEKPLAIVFGNEVVWVEKETLEIVDSVVYIPMKGEKESLNIGQSAAIFMWELAIK